jgi:hypothetical protein
MGFIGHLYCSLILFYYFCQFPASHSRDSSISLDWRLVNLSALNYSQTRKGLGRQLIRIGDRIKQVVKNKNTHLTLPSDCDGQEIEEYFNRVHRFDEIWHMQLFLIKNALIVNEYISESLITITGTSCIQRQWTGLSNDCKHPL